MHIHLVNWQKVKQFPFDVDAYTKKYFETNGGTPDRHGFAKAPLSLDPEAFRTGDDELPKAYEKVFRDTIDVMPGYVTILRVKFAKNDGSEFKSFDVKGQRYVIHCHMLEHEDNEMMKYFCLK
jgi:FtsP/CotA-like multicopper oxidase with cupredoxin domain